MSFPVYSIANTEARVAVGLDSDDNSEDTILEAKLLAAVAQFEAMTGGRTFYVAAASDKYFRAEHVDGLFLWLGGLDLCTLVSVTNGDADGTSITVGDLVTIPENEGPPWDVLWWPDGDGWDIDDDTLYITVNGKWGYSEALPEDVKHALLALLCHFYNVNKDEGKEQITLPTGQVLTVRRAVPADVVAIVTKYKRLF